MSSGVSIHTGFFLSLQTEHLGPLSLTAWARAAFPTRRFLLAITFTQCSLSLLLSKPENPFFPPPGCPVGCVNVPFPLCNLISWVVLSCSVALHNPTDPVCQSKTAFFLFFFSFFEPQMRSLNGDDIKLGADSLPPSSHRWACSIGSCYTTQKKKNWVAFIHANVDFVLLSVRILPFFMWDLWPSCTLENCIVVLFKFLAFRFAVKLDLEVFSSSKTFSFIWNFGKMNITGNLNHELNRIGTDSNVFTLIIIWCVVKAFPVLLILITPS